MIFWFPKQLTVSRFDTILMARRMLPSRSLPPWLVVRTVSCFVLPFSCRSPTLSVSFFFFRHEINHPHSVVYLAHQSLSVPFFLHNTTGVGFLDEQAPWGNKWFGKGAKTGGWFHNFRIPFFKSLRVTAELPSDMEHATLWTIVRGQVNLPIMIEGIQIPTNARMVLQKKNLTNVAPLAFVDVVDQPSGSGLVFMHTLSVATPSLNFLEGCYHMYSPYNQSFPGLLLSTGTEDFFDSAFYFNAGQFHMDVSGFTHWEANDGNVEFSAYRMQHMDPLVFRDGVKITWRNGDMYSTETGEKCFTEAGGKIVGTPKPAQVQSYSWLYVW